MAGDRGCGGLVVGGCACSWPLSAPVRTVAQTPAATKYLQPLQLTDHSTSRAVAPGFSHNAPFFARVGRRAVSVAAISGAAQTRGERETYHQPFLSERIA